MWLGEWQKLADCCPRPSWTHIPLHLTPPTHPNHTAFSKSCLKGNNEEEFYADRPQNLRVEGGNLVITAM